MIAKDSNLTAAQERLTEGFRYLCDAVLGLGEPPCPAPQPVPWLARFSGSPWTHLGFNSLFGLGSVGLATLSGGKLGLLKALLALKGGQDA